MKPNYLGLRTVVYYVSNLEEAKVWYAKAFKTRPYFDEVFYVGFNIGGYELGLLPEKEASANKDQSVVAYWGVEDLEGTLANMLELGAVKDDEPLDVGGGVVVASVTDPWGNILGLIYNPHFKISD